jgi:hypothetical protein
VLVAFDHMRVKISYLEWAYRFLDVYRKLFKNDETGEEEGERVNDISGRNKK